MRSACEWRSVSNTQYKDFCQKYPDVNLSAAKWRAVIQGFNKAFRDKVLTSGDKIKYPFGFGDWVVAKRKMRSTAIINGKEIVILPIDWKKTKEKGKYIYHFNYHTEGYGCKWRWFKDSARFENSGIWNFKPAREASRLINFYLQDENHTYLDKYKEWK